MRKTLLTLLIFLVTCTSPLFSIVVDLKEPSYSDGVLSTEKGGVVSAQNLRVQAKRILYTRKELNGVLQVYLEAEGDLIVECGEYVFVGNKLEYDFEKKEGILFEGRTGIDPWFFGGKEIHLCSDGSYLIYNGFATTSENYDPDWMIETEQASLKNHRILSAKNVAFRFFKIPLFWVPSFRVNLNSIFDSPIRYTVRFGGTKGTRVGLSYDILDWGGLKTRLRLDYRFKWGLGGGVELDYKSPTNLGRFRSVSYIAKDETLYNRKSRTRYRYFGDYENILDNGKTNIWGSYDVLSDKEMATDYGDRGLQLNTAKRTQIEILRLENSWILDLQARFRVNKFQTVKQELPTLSGSLKPFTLGETGVIAENRFSLSYLELEFTDDRPEGKNFNSPRYELYSNFYRPINFQNWTLTPQTGAVSIYYGNNPNKHDRWMALGLFQLDLNTDLYRFFGNTKHLITPYAKYQYFTHPTTSPNDHYIFDINDGWYRLNMLRFGVSNHFYTKTDAGCIYRKFYADLFAFSFFDTETLPYEVPKIYTKIVYNPSPFMRNTVDAAWDLQRNMLDHWNCRLEWTVSRNIALSAEYRHRSAYDWRKADHQNFILDSFQSAEELSASSLSDRRDTFLLTLYYRFHPNWALGIQSRNGWNHKYEPQYNEFEVDLLGKFRSSWHLRISYRHREEDDRISLNFSIGLQKPDPAGEGCRVPCLEF